MQQIKLKKYKPYKNTYHIIRSSQKICNISFIRKHHMIIIGYIEIKPEYQQKHYWYAVIKHLLFHYKPYCIIGESLYSSRTFWNKCIHKYNGQRKNITYSDNCSSSFVIPKYDISTKGVYNLLEMVSNRNL